MDAGKSDAVRAYVLDRIKVEDRGHSTPCWVWQLSLNTAGYGQGLAPGAARVEQAHRFSYRAFTGPIPDGLHLDHLCRVRDCCNPAHLEPVSPAENARRAAPFMLHSHCKRGHELAGTNVSVGKWGRRCRLCKNEWARANTTRYARSGLPVANPRPVCAKGHPLTPENTIVWKSGQRRCRICNVAWRAEHDDHRARFRSARLRAKEVAARETGGDGLRAGSDQDVIARRHGGGK